MPPKSYTKAEAVERAVKSVTDYYSGAEGTAFSGFNPSWEFFQVFESHNDGAGFAINRYEGYDADAQDGVDEIHGGQVSDLRYDRNEGELDESLPKPSEKAVRKQAEYIVELAGF